jgi:hypothetical protein
MKLYFYTLLHLFYPAGIEHLRCNQTQFVSNVQPYYSTGDLPAKENMQMKKQLILIVLIFLTTLTLASCAPRVTSPTILSPEEGAAYAAEVDDVVENMLIGLSQKDWAMYSRDFHKAMLAEMEDTFQQEYNETIGVIGAYQSKTLDHVETRGDQRIIIYHGVFENNPDVTISMYFGINDPNHLIQGYGTSFK